MDLNFIRFIRFCWINFKIKKLRNKNLWFWDIFSIVAFILIVGSIFRDKINTQHPYLYVAMGYCSLVMTKTLVSGYCNFVYEKTNLYSYLIDKKELFILGASSIIANIIIQLFLLVILSIYFLPFYKFIIYLVAVFFVIFYFFLFGIIIIFISKLNHNVTELIKTINRYSIFITPIFYDLNKIESFIIYIIYINPHYWAIFLLRDIWLP